MVYRFQTTAYDTVRLLPEVEAALAKRIEAEGRKRLPGLWNVIDRIAGGKLAETANEMTRGRRIYRRVVGTLLLLVGLFLMIGGIGNMGVIDALAQLMAKLGAGNPFLMYTIIVWASVLISAFIDNIPYVATMIPVIAGIAMEMGIDSTALYFGLLSGATLGGNCTPIGASANIAGIGILRKEGYEVKNGDFFKIGIPFTLAAIIPAYIYLWLVFGI